MTQNEIDRKREESQKASQKLKEVAAKGREERKWMYLDKVAPVTRCYRLSNYLSFWTQAPGKNVLFMTGLPASGKSTLARYLSDRIEDAGISCDVFSLDIIGFYKSLRGVKSSMLNNAEKHMLSLLEGVNDDYSRAANAAWYKFYQETLDKMMHYFDSHPDTLYIVEGIQLTMPQSAPYLSRVKKSPLIVVDTPIKECIARRRKNNKDEQMNSKEMEAFYQKCSSNLHRFESMVTGGSSPTPLSKRLIPGRENASESSIALEGLFDFFKKKEEKSNDDILSTWQDKLFTRESANLVGGKPITQPLRLLTLKKCTIDKKTQTIHFQNINLNLLLQRMKEFYGEKKLDQIFDRTYDKRSIDRFKRKKITRAKMKVTSVYTPVFFALELVCIFNDLGYEYNDKTYLSLARMIYKNTWLAESDKIKISDIKIDTEPLKDFNDGFALKDHQREFIEQYPKLKARLNLNGYILAFDQGLGKTLTATALSKCLHATQTFIVCPNSLKEVWRDEIRKYLKRYQDPKLFQEEVIVCGANSDHTDTAKFIITNQEAIPNAYPYATGKGSTMLIIDEVHNFRNIEGKRTQELLELKKRMNAKDILPMSGTPIKASPSELTPAIALIDPLFTEHAAEIYNVCFKLNDTAAMDMVQQRFGKIIYRKTKQILSLPEKSVTSLKWKIKNPEKFYMANIREAVMQIFKKEFEKKLSTSKELLAKLTEYVTTYSTATTRENKIYLNYLIDVDKLAGESVGLHELDQDFIDKFLDTYVIPKLRTAHDKTEVKDLEKQFIRMKQSALGIAVGQIYPPYRAELFTKLIDENIDTLVKMIENNPSKTVIFSQIRPVVLHLQEILPQHGIGTVCIVGGSGNMGQRMEVIESFKYDDNITVLGATSQTLGTGVTLIEATQMFFFGPPWRSTDFDQCCDRIHRIGQTQPVNIYNVSLDTKAFNLSDRMEKIMSWSNQMFSASMDIEEDSKIANEAFLQKDLLQFFNQF